RWLLRRLSRHRSAITLRQHHAILFETRRDDRRRGWGNKGEKWRSKGHPLGWVGGEWFTFGGFPPRFCCRLPSAFAATPIEFCERREGRHPRDRAVGEFGDEGRADAILGLGASEVFRSSRFDDAIALGADDRERVDERRSLV